MKLESLAPVIGDPALFARGFLGLDLWDTQEAILRAVAHHPRVAVKACHASSKTLTAAAAALWWLVRYPDGKVLTTAPTWTQVEEQLWREIRAMAATAEIDFPLAAKTAIEFGPERWARGLSTDQGVRFQGYHGRILVIVDEAVGLRADIWEAIEGIRAGGQVHVLALGNPTTPSGPFFEAFREGGQRWKTFTISALDTPNLRGLSLSQLLELPEDALDDNVRPYLVTRRWVREKWEEWGRHDAPQWRARVLGEFPDQADNALLRLAWLEAWRRKPAVDDGRRAVSAGVDVAGPGKSETVVAIQSGGRLLALHATPAEDPRGEVALILEQYRSRLVSVKVDRVGMGEFFGQHLADLGFPVLLVNVGEGAYDPLRYENLKAELYWYLRGYAVAGSLSGLTDPLAFEQLAQLQFDYTPRGRIAMETKDAMRRRGLSSPDRAEAIMLAMAPLQPPEEIDWEELYERERVRISDY